MWRGRRRNIAGVTCFSSWLSSAFLMASNAFFLYPANRNGHGLSSVSTNLAALSASMTLEELQERASRVIASFDIKETFEPKLGNGHLQSIFGFFLRESCSYVPRNEPLVDFIRRIQRGFDTASTEVDNAAFWDERERVKTPDGDWFHVDHKRVGDGAPAGPGTAADTAGAPTVLLLHGLTSSSYGNLAVEMARAFTEQGFNVAAINFRGCSKDDKGCNIPNDTIGAYHLGFTDDLLHYIEVFRNLRPNTPIYLAGFSLGANVVLKCLGDMAERALDLNVQGAAALCAPLDQVRNAPVLARPFSIQRYVYTDGLLKALKTMALSQLDRLQAHDVVSVERIRHAETISEFDDAFIAPIYGFKDCWEYYQQTSSIHVLDKVAVPTLILNAKDDPFFDNDVWPTEKSSECGGPAPLKMVQETSGGHLGFIFHQVDENDPRLGTKVPSFGSVTAAEFLRHAYRHAGAK